MTNPDHNNDYIKEIQTQMATQIQEDKNKISCRWDKDSLAKLAKLAVSNVFLPTTA